MTVGGEDRLLSRHGTALIAFVLLSAYAYFYEAGGWNQNSRFDLVRAIVEQHALIIDDYAFNTGDRAIFNGHLYSDKAPGQALMAVPTVALVSEALRLAGADPAQPTSVAVLSYLATIWAAGLPTLVAALCLAWVAVRLGAGPGGATFAALAFGLATPAWAYATLFWGHALAAGWLAVAFAGAVALRHAGEVRRRDLWTGVLVGAAGGSAVLTEYPAAPAAAMIAVLALVHGRAGDWGRCLRLGLPIAAGASIPMLVLVTYNFAAFGSPLAVSYEGVQGFVGMRQGLLGVSFPRPAVIKEILFGSYRGLLPLAPVIGVAPLGGLLLWQRPQARPTLVAASAIAAYYILLNAAYVYWNGGWSYGPRHLGASLPFMCLGLAPLWSRTRWPLRTLLIGLAIWGTALSGLSVSTLAQLDDTVAHPVTQIVWPAFAQGEMALSRSPVTWLPGQISQIPEPLVGDGAWNLGQLLFGLQGHASLIPLAAMWLAAGGVALSRSGTHMSALRRYKRIEAGSAQASTSS